MKVAFYSLHKFEKEYFLQAAGSKHELKFIDPPLSLDTVQLASGCKGACIFVNDNGSAPVLQALKQTGIEFLILRSSGFNHVDLKAARDLGIRIARVPEYSPHAIAEHSLALMLTLNRKLIRAHQRIMDLNFSLDGLVGFDMNGKTVGIIGTGKIGKVAAKILFGFGCRILAYDMAESEELKEAFGVIYADLETLYSQADIISLHIPLTEKTKYMIDSSSIAMMKPGVMLINTSRGKLVNTKDVIEALKTGHIGSFGLDVYEEEEGLFFEDHSEEILQDDTIARLLSFRNVLITSHQAFLTDTALHNIADTTIHNLDSFENKTTCNNEISI